jgi:shikimate kinase
MASGKSTVGRRLAERLGRPFVDNDLGLERLAGATAARHAARHGLAALHDLELEVLRAALADPVPAVVTAAASVGDRPELPDLVAGHPTVWLDVDPAVLASRVPPGGDHRPSGATEVVRLQEQRAQRAATFAAAADLVVRWGGESPDAVVDRIVTELGL